MCEHGGGGGRGVAEGNLNNGAFFCGGDQGGLRVVAWRGPSDLVCA